MEKDFESRKVILFELAKLSYAEHKLGVTSVKGCVTSLKNTERSKQKFAQLQTLKHPSHTRETTIEIPDNNHTTDSM